jgi:EAL and modified HD-GYP domain-containing signal transduction protein
LNVAEYVALGAELSNSSEAEKIVRICQTKERKVIAYGIDHTNDFESSKLLGMNYYCGDFLFEPNQNDTSTISANKVNLLELMRFLQAEEINLQKVIELIETDALLSYQLFKLTNSAAFAGLQPIESIDQAISRLGLIQLKNWAMLFSMKNLSNKPIEIIESGLIRAHMAAKLTTENKEHAYTAGLLSILDGVLNKPMSSIMDTINVSKNIENALVSHSGELGELLALVKAYESGNFDLVPSLEYNGLDLSEIYIQALEASAQGMMS